MDENEQEFHLRGFDPRSTKYQSKEIGKVIKSSRKFGIEVEMFHSVKKGLHELHKNISRVFGIEHDGSIDAAGGYGIEVVSPILKGQAGEKAVIELFSVINKIAFSVNRSCGLHVHLDGKDFGKSDKTYVSRIRDVSTDVLANLKGDDYAFVIREEVMSTISNRRGLEAVEVARLIADEYIGTEGNSLFLSKELGFSLPEIVRKNALYESSSARTMIDLFAFERQETTGGKTEAVVIDKLVPDGGDYLCILYNNKSLTNILTLLYLHTVFSDVFMSMLPKSRRQDNLYCQGLNQGFSAGQIENIGTFTELENAWYKTRTAREASRRKGNNYDESRYFSINLHSLFAKYGTIEIRSHSATLDPNKVLYWVAFHQEILDRIVSGHITIGLLKQGANIFDTKEKTEFLMSVLGLRPALLKYMEQRIDYFRNNETK